MPREKVLWIREPYLQQILIGRKTVEVRVGYSNITRLEVGDYLRLNDEHRVRIVRIGHYTTFEEMLQQESPAAIAPDLPVEELLPRLREIYPAEKESLGVVALEVELLN
jgi:ASC-1-like (ASCH) protein